MKKKVIDALCLCFLSGVLCALYQPEPRFGLLAAGGCAAYAAVRLLPRRSLALAAAAAISVGMSVFDLRYLASCAPAVFAAALLSAAAEGDASLPPGKDGFFCTAALLSAAADLAAAACIFAGLRVSPFTAHPFGRYDLFLAALSVCLVWLLCRALRAKKNAPGGRGKKDRSAARLAAALIGTLCAAGVCVTYYFTQNGRLWSALWPVFLCVYAAASYAL